MTPGDQVRLKCRPGIRILSRVRRLNSWPIKRSEDIDEIDTTKWELHEGSYLSPKGKGASILKSDTRFKTVKEAMSECRKHTSCKGVTDDFKTNKITMRVSGNPIKSQQFMGNSWIKK